MSFDTTTRELKHGNETEMDYQRKYYEDDYIETKKYKKHTPANDGPSHNDLTPQIPIVWPAIEELL